MDPKTRNMSAMTKFARSMAKMIPEAFFSCYVKSGVMPRSTKKARV